MSSPPSRWPSANSPTTAGFGSRENRPVLRFARASALQLGLERGLRRGPLLGGKAEHGGVAHVAVVTRLVAAQDALEGCADPRDGRAGLRVALVGLQLHAHRAEVLERVPELQVFRLGVDGRALRF